MTVQRSVAFLLVGTLVLAGTPRGGARQTSSTLPTRQQIVAEALAAARADSGPVDRLEIALAVLPIVQRTNPAGVRPLAVEAVAIVKKLPQRMTTVPLILGAIFMGIVLPYGIFLAPYAAEESVRQRTRQALTIKGAPSLRLVQLLSDIDAGDRALALEAAQAIEEPFARAQALRAFFETWSSSSAAAGIQAARGQATRRENDRSAAALAGLASGVAHLDKRLAIELIQRALERTRAGSRGNNRQEETFVHEVLATLDPVLAERDLERAIASTADSRNDELLTIADALTKSHPVLAWRALKADSERGARHVMEIAYAVRQVAELLPPAMNDEVQQYVVELFPRRKSRVFAAGADGHELIATADLLATLARIDEPRAWQDAESTTFDRLIAANLLMASPMRNREFLDRFLVDLVRLEVALSVLERRPSNSIALGVLESLDERFWTSIGKATWNRDGTPEDSSEIILWLSERLAQVRTRWLEAARALAAADPAASVRTLRRFQSVAGWVDAVAVDQLGKRSQRREALIRHLPFFLADAAEAMATLDRSAADEAIHQSVTLASSLSSPAREWALCRNAEAFKEIDSAAARAAVADAMDRARRLKGHGDSNWASGTPRFAGCLARLDLTVAYSFARKGRSPSVPTALMAVASEMRDN